MPRYYLTKDGVATGGELVAGSNNMVTYTSTAGVSTKQRFAKSHPWSSGALTEDMVNAGYAVGGIIPDPLDVPDDLDTVKEFLCGQVDEAAETVRLRYVTSGYGQAMTYREKLEEALDIDLDGNPQAADYPICAASVGIEGVDLEAVATLVIARYDLWRRLAAAIESIRLGGKKAIKDAADPAGAHAAAAAVDWSAVG